MMKRFGEAKERILQFMTIIWPRMERILRRMKMTVNFSSDEKIIQAERAKPLKAGLFLNQY